MKFDMNAAWRDTTTLLQGNKELLLVIAGLFFFLPALAIVLFVPEMRQDLNGLEGDALMGAVTQMYQDNWYWFVFTTLLQSVGVLAMLALLRSAQKPTVGDALTTGATALFPYLLAQILLGIGIALALVLPISLAAASGIPALVALFSAMAIPVLFYLMVKFAMVAPIMAIERNFNPFAAFKQSWQLSKGNSIRIFLFFALVLVAIFVIVIVLSLVAQLIGAAMGGAITEGIITSALGAVYTTVFTAILAATYRQLSSKGSSDIGDTFD